MKKLVVIFGVLFGLISVIHADDLNPTQLAFHFAQIDELNKNRLEKGDETIYYDGLSLRRHFLHEEAKIVISKMIEKEKRSLESILEGK